MQLEPLQQLTTVCTRASKGEPKLCILTGKEICKRRDQIFHRKSWSSESFQEASYDLRVDTGPFLRIGGKVYEQGMEYKGTHMRIMPGEMALLPTIESFNMPCDLVGDIKIKFSHSRKGLAPLFGPKVDPYFGKGHPDERLYLWVSNLGTSPITLTCGERVFAVQFHKLWGDAPDFDRKVSIGPMVAQEAYSMGVGTSLGFIDQIEENVKQHLGARLTQVERGTERVVLFGVFLVASALLAGAVTTLFMTLPRIDSDSGSTLMDILEGSPLAETMYWASIALGVSVAVLGIAVVVQVLMPLAKLVLGGIGTLLQASANCYRRFRWRRNSRTKKG